MAGRLSLPFDTLNDPEHPKTFRSAKHETLGKGHSLDRVGKKMVWLVYEALRDDLIKINTSFVKESLLNSRDKTAWLLEISNGPVKKVITEAKATGGFANPGQRGGTPYEQSGCASAEAVAAIHGSVYSLQHKNPPVPTTVPKILREIAKDKYADDQGELLKLTPKMVHRLLHLCGYIWGAATEHHVAKLTTGNIKYRVSYCQRVLNHRETGCGGFLFPKGYPQHPEYFQDESYCNAGIDQ